ncbi:CopG family transcriptional regulator [Candidatus Woesebacteria bacterium]|nr:CopG family transcriptional regulator [Candidatus Woesebacteria bacterium]
MKKILNDGYTDGPILLGKRIKDFLPKPEDLILKEPTTKITITLDSASVDFFKKEATRLNSSYQRMMRNLLTEYANRMKSKEDLTSTK